jgi:hypothetical protein
MNNLFIKIKEARIRVSTIKRYEPSDIDGRTVAFKYLLNISTSLSKSKGVTFGFERKQERDAIVDRLDKNFEV